MALFYPDTLKSNNPNSFGIVFAEEVIGHKKVLTYSELSEIPTAILGENPEGQIWYVIEEDKYYKLNPNKSWIEYKTDLSNYATTKDLDKKLDKPEIEATNNQVLTYDSDLKKPIWKNTLTLIQGDNILIEGNIISGDYKLVTSDKEGLMSSNDKNSLDILKEYNYALVSNSLEIEDPLDIRLNNVLLKTELFLTNSEKEIVLDNLGIYSTHSSTGVINFDSDFITIDAKNDVSFSISESAPTKIKIINILVFNISEDIINIVMPQTYLDWKIIDSNSIKMISSLGSGEYNFLFLPNKKIIRIIGDAL